MTTSAAEGTEYLVIGVSEQLSSLACARTDGKIDIWNLDQAMRDAPIQGAHPDVITALLFVDAHHLLLSADDSGSIMAWFVRPSRWKGQLAFELRTPPLPRSSDSSSQQQSTFSQPPLDNDDPIRQVHGLSTVPGISCMGFHAPSGMLFCGHRNGHIAAWSLSPLLDFLARISADATSSWFAPSATTTNGTKPSTAVPSPTTSTVNSAFTSPTHTPMSRSRSSILVPLHHKQPSTTTTTSSSHTLTLPSLGNPSSSTTAVTATTSLTDSPIAGASSTVVSLSSLPIKEQLSRLAASLRPSYVTHAHESSVSTLHVVLDPPALLSTSLDHVAHVWTLDGAKMGELDAVVGLAKGYATSSGATFKGPPSPPWTFSVNVAARERKDRSNTHEVLKELEGMARAAVEAEASAAAAAAARSRPSSALPPGRHSRASSSATQAGLGSPVKSVSGSMAASPLSPTRSPSLRRRAVEEKEPSSSNHLLPPTSSPASASVASSVPASPAAPFFLSTPLSPVENYGTVTKGFTSPGSRATAGAPPPRPTTSSRSTTLLPDLPHVSAHTSATSSAATSHRSARSVVGPSPTDSS